MFIFLRLLLAHCIGDFPLQLNSIFKLKEKGFFGVIPHTLIIVTCCAVLSWPYLGLPLMWLFIGFVGITHLIQDSIKISFKNPRYNFLAYVLDQLFHAGIMGLIFFTDLKNLQAPIDQSNLFARLYSNDFLIIYLIVLILATYNGLFLIRSFKISFLGDAGGDNVFEKWYGMSERALMVTCFLAKDQVVIFLVAIMLMRPLIFLLRRNQLKISREFVSLREILLSWTIALAGGCVLLIL